MIIGISGRMGSGKDTIGQIIQYLSWQRALDNSIGYETSFDEYLENKPGGYTGVFKIKKYADSLKDMVCILLGCTREQLEDREFKEKELGEEWFKCRIIQKDQPNYYVGTLEEAQEICHIGSNKRYVPVEMTPRLLLQLLGTDAGREILHPNVWVNALMSQYRPLNPEKRASMGNVLDYSNCDFPNWIITDMRFPNEAEAIKDRGGTNIRVNTNRAGIVSNHPSETSLDDYKFDYTIDNSGTIDELIIKVKAIMDEFQKDI